jgi:hypothetical protein
VKQATGLGHATIYEWMARGDFPKPVPLGGRRVGWIDAEILDCRISASLNVMRGLQPPKRESRPGHWAASFVFGAGRFARPGLSILRASVRVRPAPATIPRPARRDNHRSNFDVTVLSETIPPVNTDVPLEIPVSPPPWRRLISRKRRRRISRETWASLRAAISHQRESLPPDSPRVRPTLPHLRWMEAGR